MMEASNFYIEQVYKMSFDGHGILINRLIPRNTKIKYPQKCLCVCVWGGHSTSWNYQCWEEGDIVVIKAAVSATVTQIKSTSRVKSMLAEDRFHHHNPSDEVD